MVHSFESGPPPHLPIFSLRLSRHARYQNVGNFVYFLMSCGPICANSTYPIKS